MTSFIFLSLSVRGDNPHKGVEAVSLSSLWPAAAMSVAGFVTVCRKGNLSQLEAMLRQNPNLNVNAKNERGRTGLMMAAYEGRAQVAEALLRMAGMIKNSLPLYIKIVPQNTN